MCLLAPYIVWGWVWIVVMVLGMWWYLWGDPVITSQRQRWIIIGWSVVFVLCVPYLGVMSEVCF